MTTPPPPPPAPAGPAAADLRSGPVLPPPPAAPGILPEAAPGWTPEPAPGSGFDVWAVPASSVFGSSGQDWTLRLLAGLLALAVTDPAGWFSGSLMRLLVPLVAVVGALFAGGPVAARPVAISFRWASRLSQHRNTMFTACCVLLAALVHPPVWLAACDTALLLSYLLLLDAIVGGPPAAELLRRPAALLSVYAGCAVVLAAVLVPVASTGSWARLVAALALAASGTGALTALRLHRRPPPPPP